MRGESGIQALQQLNHAMEVLGSTVRSSGVFLCLNCMPLSSYAFANILSHRCSESREAVWASSHEALGGKQSSSRAGGLPSCMPA
jgi:hypothetical protein